MEVWKDIQDYEGLYQISNLGRVKSLKRITQLKKNQIRIEEEKIIKQTQNNKGYLYASLSKNNKRKIFRVHRLVAIHFLENPENKPEVNHKDENKHNNCVDNLEWCNHLDNVRYGECIKKATESRFKKINQYDLDGNYIKTWNSCLDIKKQYKNIHLWEVLNGKRKTAKGYVWKYCK